MIVKREATMIVPQNRALARPSQRSLALIRRALPLAGAAVALTWSLSHIVPRLLARLRLTLRTLADVSPRRAAAPELVYHARMSITVWKKDG